MLQTLYRSGIFILNYLHNPLFFLEPGEPGEETRIRKKVGNFNLSLGTNFISKGIIYFKRNRLL